MLLILTVSTACALTESESFRVYLIKVINCLSCMPVFTLSDLGDFDMFRSYTQLIKNIDEIKKAYVDEDTTKKERFV